MRRIGLAAVGIVAALAGAVIEARRQEVPPIGLIIESIEPGSALEVAGVRPGDGLVSWARTSSTVSRGEFRTPFDARAFELEQLPRGDTVVTVVRNGKSLDAKLNPGSWDTTVRPAFSSADLQVYLGGAALEKDRPLETLDRWQPLIDRLSREGKQADAAWLLTRVASALAVLDERDQAKATFVDLNPRATEIFDQAAALFREPANPAFEAMVWEAKGRACSPEVQTAFSLGDVGTREPRRLKAALDAHQRARSLRISVNPELHRLAIAESEYFVIRAIGFDPQYFVSPDAPGGPETSALAERFSRQIIETFEQQAPESFAFARALFRIGSNVPNLHGRYGTGVLVGSQGTAVKIPYLLRALDICETVSPTNSLLGAIFRNLNPVSLRDSDPFQVETLLSRQIEFAERIGERATVRTATMNLVSVRLQRGDTTALQSVEPLLQSDADLVAMSGNITSLAAAAYRQGARAEALALVDKLSPVASRISSPASERVLSLARTAAAQGSIAFAEHLVEIFLPLLKNDAVDLATKNQIRLAMSRLQLDRGDNKSARVTATEGLALIESTEIKSRDVLDWLSILMAISARVGDRESEIAYVKRAIVVADGIPNQSPLFKPDMMIRLARLNNDLPAEREASRLYAATLKPRPAATLSTSGSPDVSPDPEHAERLLVEALESGPANGVATLTALADLTRMRGNLTASRAYKGEALALFERDRLRADQGIGSWGGSAVSMALYFRATAAFLEDGEAGPAFETADRSRGMAFARMLAERRNGGTAPRPAEFLAQQRALEAEYVKILKTVGSSAVTNGLAVDRAFVELGKVRAQLNELDRRNAGDARLRNPEPLTLAQARARLDPGTVLLSYLVTPDTTYLFVLSPERHAETDEPDVRVYPLRITESVLRQRVEAFRTMIDWDIDPRTANRRELTNQARQLYDVLVRPAELQIEPSMRILVSPDGPLNALPFDALVRGRQDTPQYLVQWKPVHFVPSMGVYAETLASRRPVDRTGPFLGFGDPDYAGVAKVAVDVNRDAVLRAGASLTPLPGSGREVRAIAAMFGPRATVYTGAAATGDRARTIGTSARFLHFAVHGVLNQDRPLDSALLFSVPRASSQAPSNGVLMAWQIIEHVRIDADLVTLSACESGLGKLVAGEGPVGLTRAFLYAGARTVVASLWKVADEPTSELMVAFYARLRQGLPKDQALRAAKLALIGQGRRPGSSVDLSSPAYWAAFTMTGDWK